MNIFKKCECDLCVLEIVADDNSQSPLMQGSDQKLLLLYARDCVPFMDLMENLRKTLEKYCKCEVGVTDLCILITCGILKSCI